MKKVKKLFSTSWPKIFIGLGIILATIPFTELRVQAVVWCHDYTLYRLTCANGTCENANNTSPGELRRRLEKEFGYDRYPITNAAESPDYAAHRIDQPCVNCCYANQRRIEVFVRAPNTTHV